MNNAAELIANASKTSKPIGFPCADGSRMPYEIYTSPEIYQLEQERIFRGPTWSFVALEAELPNSGDFKSTFVGDTPVVVTRNGDRSLSVWVNRCAHRGAMVCRAPRGNARTHICIYHQWSYDTRGNLRGVPFRNGVKGSPGMPPDFDAKDHSLQQLRVESYRGLVFATFSDQASSLYDYIGPQMRLGLDRIFHKPIVYLGCTRQLAKSNWKLYNENVRDPYHASLLHAFLSTFNIYRVETRFEIVGRFESGGSHLAPASNVVSAVREHVSDARYRTASGPRTPRSPSNDSKCDAKDVKVVTRSTSHPEIDFKIWEDRECWFWLIVRRHSNGGAIGAAASEAEAMSDAHSSIENLSKP